MTLEDAFTVLGVEATATEDEVRRAYLRLVKKHRPESDPTGFQRVREAYDLAREPRAFDFEALATAPPTSETGAEGPDPTASNDTEVDLETFRRLALGLEEDDLEGAVELWRSAVRRLPDSAAARWELIEACFQAGKPKRAGRALLRAYRRGMPGFAAALLARAPGHAPPELHERAMHDPTLAFAAATGLVRAGDPSAAVPYLEARLTLEPGDHVGGFMLTQVIIEALSRLGARGEVVHFERLTQLFSEYLKHNEAALRGPHAAQWLVLRELGATAHALPRFVFRELADSVVRQDSTQLMQRLEIYGEEYPAGAAQAREVLKFHAPGLYNAYAPLLEPIARVASTPEWRRKGFGWPGVGTLLALVFMSLRFCLPSGTREDRPRPTAASWAPSTAPRDIFGRPLTTPPSYSQTIVDRAVSTLALQARDLDLPEVGIRARAVGEAFYGDCSTLTREMETLAELTRNQDASMVNEMQILSVEFRLACPSNTVPKP